MKYDAVVFDLFGTLIDNGSQESIDRLYREQALTVGAPLNEFTAVWPRIRHGRDTGQFGSLEGDMKAACTAIGYSPTPAQVKEAVQVRLVAYRKDFTPRTTAIETLSKLRSAGIKLALVSDCGLEIPEIWSDSPLAPLFDATVFSCDAGTTKPDPLMYRLACERLEVKPERCLYVGDGGSRELTGALNMGMHPVLIRVDYERHLDVNRPDAVEWTGPVISDLSEVLGLMD